jgi:hypothetical protein
MNRKGLGSRKLLSVFQPIAMWNMARLSRWHWLEIPRKRNPVYVRGLAFLAAHDGPGAAAEFSKIVANRNIVANDPIGALAQFQLGRALALSGDTAGAKAAYQDFLSLWKDADPDIPVLQQARTESAKLQ